MRMRTALLELVKKNRIFMLALLTMLLCGMFVGLYWLSEERSEQAREHASAVAETQLFRLRLLREDMAQQAKSISMLLLRQDGSADNFSVFAAKIMESNPMVLSVQLAPGGVLDAVWPEGMAAADMPPGTRLFENDRWAQVMRWAREEKRAAFVAEKPYVTLLQPVYLPRGEQEEFWGFIVMKLSWQRFLQQTGFEVLAQEGLGYEIYQSPFWQPGSERLLARSERHLAGTLAERSLETEDGSLRVCVAQGSWWFDMLLLMGDALLGLVLCLLLAGAAVVLHDLYQEKQSLEYLSLRDALTGLYNRRKFVESLEKACGEKKPFLLCYIDFNHFKNVNDTYGHDVGDQLLEAGARRLSGCLAGDGMLFRLGGDEFAAYIAAPGSPEERAARVELLNTCMEEPFCFGAITLHMTISVGYVQYPQDAEDCETLIRMADQRMYVDKQRRSAQGTEKERAGV